MPDVIKGSYTLRQLLNLTKQHEQFRNRFDNRDRDVIKRITIKEVRELSYSKPGAPTIKYVIETYSYPQYPPYSGLIDVRRGRQTQRRIRHEYDTVLELDRLSIDTIHWKMRLGSGRKWVRRPPQSQVKQIYRETMRKWRRQFKGKKLREKIQKHKKSAKYLDVGDYNSQVLGINGDFTFRCAWAYYVHGHLFGRQYYGNIPSRITNPHAVMFATKHTINILEVLMRRGILKEG